MTELPELPEPRGSIAFASDGYDGEWVSSQGAYSEDQMLEYARDYGRTKYLRAIEDCLLLIDNEYLNWSDFRPLENLETVIRALRSKT